MKSRKLLALFLTIFMLASMIVPASAETITPDVNDVTTGTTVGYDAALVEKVDLTNVDDIKTYDAENPKDAYKITDVAGWAAFDNLVDASSQGSLLGKTVYLANDLDFEGATITPIGTFNWDSNNGWNPYSFSGVFDGQGHTIKNVTIEATAANEVANGFFGLFNRIVPVYGYDCGVKNFIIDSTVKYSVPSTIAAYSGGGCLVGTVQGVNNSGSWTSVADMEIYNVCNKANVEYSSKTVSGLVAFAKCCNLTMTNCENQGDITYTGSQTKTLCSAGIGGLLGSFAEKAKTHVGSLNMSNCRNAGDITISPAAETACGNAIGGLIGVLSNPSGNTKTGIYTVSNSINNGNITVSANVNNWTGAAGILAYHNECAVANVIELDSCINYGTIVCDATGGGSSAASIILARYTTVDTTENNTVNTVLVTNCVDATGKIDPTYHMVAKYYQMSTTATEGKYSLRLVALHNGALTALDSYSYDVTIQYGDTTVSANTGKLFTVKTSIVADNMGEGATVITNEMLDCDYISAVRIDNIPVSIGEITVTIVPTMTKDGVDTAAAPITFTVDPAVYTAQ